MESSVMSDSSLFRTTPSWTVDEVRAYMEQQKPEDYTLLDVRQPEEYAEGHLPGSTLIPVGELHQRMDEIDRTKPVIVYCRSGMRAANGTGVLLNAGLDDVRNMAGGILAWEGAVATGAPDAGMWWFQEARSPVDYIALAWILEEGAKLFYSRMADQFASLDAGDLFKALAADEAHHKDTLRSLYGAMTGKEGDPLSPEEVAAHDTMEGGVSLTKVLEWADGRGAVDVLEFSVAMEVNSNDLYLKVGKSVADEKSRAVLFRLAHEEKRHLDRLTEAFIRLRK
jgi:rhodanese-related sulfurtransferase/rubrerythrin